MNKYEPHVSKIISKDNKLYRDCLKLQQKKHRDEDGVFLVEGENLVDEACRCGQAILVICNEECDANAKIGDTPSVRVKNNLFKSLSDTKTPQGIMAVVKKPDEAGFVEQVERTGDILILDRLQDPGNIGTILRTAEAAGAAGVIIIKGTADVYSPKVVRAAAGSVLRVPIYQADDAREAVNIAKRSGRPIIATTTSATKGIKDVDSENVCFVIGNEGNGISQELMGFADENVMIPMAGGVESLNAAIAAAIMMYRNK